MSESGNQEPVDFRTVFEKVPGLYLILTPELQIVAVSDSYLEATLTSRETILGRPLFMVFPDNPADPMPTGVRNLSASLERVLNSKRPDRMALQKYDVPRPEGGFKEKYWTPLNSPVLDEQGNVKYIIHQVEDVTQQVQLKESFDVLFSNSLKQQEQIETLKRAAQYQLLVENVKDYAIFMLDPRGRVLTWNEGAERMKGYRDVDILGVSFAKFFPPGAVHAKKPESLLEMAAATGRSEDEGWSIRKDGTRFWADSVLTAIRDDKGTLLGFARVTRDLTERKHLLEILSESEARYRALFENSFEAIFLTSAEGAVLDANPAGCRLFGYSREEVKQLRRAELLDETDPRTAEALETRRKTGATRALLTFRRKDGSHFEGEVASSIYRGKDGQQNASVIIRDVSEQVRAAEAMARLAAIVTYSQDAIYSTSAESFVFTTWNQAAEKLYGYRAEEVIGQSPLCLIPAEKLEEYQAFHAKLRRGESIGTVETHRRRKDGSLVEVALSIFPVQDENGRVFSYSVIARDITEMKRALEAVAIRTAELTQAQELNRLKDHFLSTISHEIKTPLSLITGYAELLEETCPTDETLMAGIKEGSRRLTENIEAMIDYSALFSGTVSLYTTELNLAEVAGCVLECMQPESQRRGLILSVEVEEMVPVICGDSRRIAQMLTELLRNAFRFTPPGGKVGLHIAPVNDQIRLDVWDTGSGIPQQDMGRIWEPFTQLAIGDAQRTGGLGLGLAIVKKIAELHGGNVAVSSQVGQGTTFSVYLPMGSQAGACSEA